MQGLIITLGNYNNDGRLREILQVTESIDIVSKVIVLGLDFPQNKTNNKVSYIKINSYFKNSKLKMLSYYYNVMKYLKKELRNYEFVILDNFTVAFLYEVILKIDPNMKIILDSRELYFPKDMPSFFSKELVLKEHEAIKSVDLAIVANAERAIVLQDYLGLTKRPYSYENIRFLGPIISKKGTLKRKKIIISTGGVSFKRDLEKILEDFIKLNPYEYEFHIYGSASEKDLVKLKKYNKENIIYKGKLPLEELYNKVCEADLGLVHYHKNDLNNIYCASGKLYEYIGCGIPVITTDNVTLQKLCKGNGFGISTDCNFDLRISELFNNYDFYLNNINTYFENFVESNNNEKLAKVIKDVIQDN